MNGRGTFRALCDHRISEGLTERNGCEHIRGILRIYAHKILYGTMASPHEALPVASHPIYQFYAELKNYEPKIWRRFQLMNDVTMSRLGYVLMTMFEMGAEHSFAFEMKRDDSMRSRKLPDGLMMTPVGMTDSSFPQKWRFDLIDDDADLSPVRIKSRIFDVTVSKMKDVISVPGEKMTFLYDFGDDWKIDVTLESIIKDRELPAGELPRVLEGEGYGIIEDSGGVRGLARIAEAFEKKSGESYEMYREWLGTDDIDMITFNIDNINMRLKHFPRFCMYGYEYE